MEFWGVEVKSGESLKVQPEEGRLIHISQASLGESKNSKGAKQVPLRLKINDKDFIIGTLAVEERTQIGFDLVFEKEFELSHDYKNGSVFFLGYVADDPISEDEGFTDESSDEEEALENAIENGLKPKPNSEIAKAATKTEKPDSDEDDDVDSDESDSEEDSEEESPKKVQQSKKRPSEAANVPAKKPNNGKSPAFNKAAQQGKSPAFNKAKDQSPKSGGQFSRKSPNNSNNSKGGGKKGRK